MYGHTAVIIWRVNEWSIIVKFEIEEWKMKKDIINLCIANWIICVEKSIEKGRWWWKIAFVSLLKWRERRQGALLGENWWVLAISKSSEKVVSLKKSRREQAVPKFLSMLKEWNFNFWGEALERFRTSTGQNILTERKADLAPQNTRKVLMTSLSASWIRGDSLFILIVLEAILDEKTSRILKTIKNIFLYFLNRHTKIYGCIF